MHRFKEKRVDKINLKVLYYKSNKSQRGFRGESVL